MDKICKKKTKSLYKAYKKRYKNDSEISLRSAV